jgi:transcriptional/translational regulatory protein YebC/TACO1
MGAQWKAKGKALVADAKESCLASWPRKSWWLRVAGPTLPAIRACAWWSSRPARSPCPRTRWSAPSRRAPAYGDEAVHFERVIYEGFAPHQVAVMVECLTDNVNRTAPEMRVLFRKGQLGTSGSVAWDFNHVGMIEAEPATPGADPELAAIEAGAQDFEAGDEEGTTLFWTDPTDLDLVSRALPAQGFTVLSAKLGYKPKNPVNPANLSAEQLEEVESFLAAIDANDDVQNVFGVASGTRPDPTQFDPASPYFDPKSPARPDAPRWLLLDVQALRKTRLISLAELRSTPALAQMRVLQKGSRLSITPVDRRRDPCALRQPHRPWRPRREPGAGGGHPQRLHGKPRRAAGWRRSGPIALLN